MLLLDGAEGLSQQARTGASHIALAARADHPAALYRLGELYLRGQGVRRDKTYARELVQRAAELGEAAAMTRLGGFLFDGEGQPADRIAGLAWMLVAAERGDEEAQRVLERKRGDASIEQREWRRAELRVRRLERSLPPAPLPDALLGHDRWAEAAPLAGTWSGSGRDETEDGTPLSFPLTLTIDELSGSTINAELRATVQYPVGPGQTLAVELHARFTGRPVGGMSELHARDVIAMADGQSDSLGPQTLRLEVDATGGMTGTLGNEREGWAPIELRRQGARTEPGGDARTTDAGREVDTSREATTAPRGTLILEQASVTDPGMDGMVSHTFLKPKGWQVQGGQRWNPQAYRSFVRLDLRLIAGDGRELSSYPGGFYEDSNAYEIAQQMGVHSPRPQPGQALTNGLIYMPVPASVSEYVMRVVIPHNRPKAQGLRVIGVTELTDVRRQMDEQLAPLRRNMEQGNQQLRQMGANIQSSFTAVAERVRIAYQEDGRAYEEDLWVTGTFNHTAEQIQGMPLSHSYHWNMSDSRGMRAPGGQLDQARPLLEALSLSIQQEPRYTAVIMHLQHKLNMQQLDALAQRGEIARRGREEAWRIHQSGVKERQASNDRTQELFTEYIRDIDRFQDLDGSTVRLPGLYSEVYSNGNGEYILSNEPTFDPNDHSTVRWERIDPKR